MLEILQNLIAVFKANAPLTAIVPTANILVGPVDIVTETQAGLILPQINLRVVSEFSRSVPSNTRDTSVQIDIWSRNSQLEIEQIYEIIVPLLNYTSPTQGTAKVFWERLGGAVDQYEGDRRIWHRATTFVFWSQKP
jgi:hypothetical protein